MNAEVEQIFRANEHVSHICIHPPGSEGNRDNEQTWLVVALSGGTPKRAWGKNPEQAIHYLRVALELAP